MSKSTNGLGQFRGKLGAVVYAIVNGKQIVRAYQPVVSNPKSAAQMIQRAKGNLAGRISKITPWEILIGLGANKGTRRSRFNALLLKKITAGPAAGDSSKFTAKLNDADYVFSEGSVIPLYYVASSVSLTASSVSFNVLHAGGSTAADRSAQGLLVVVLLKNPVLGWYEIMYRFLSPSDLEGATTAVQFEHRTEGAYDAAVYYAPFATADGTALRTRTGVLSSTVTSLDALLEVGTGVSPLVWGFSRMGASGSFTPSSSTNIGSRKS